MQTCLLVRGDEVEGDGHPVARDFHEVIIDRAC